MYDSGEKGRRFLGARRAQGSSQLGRARGAVLAVVCAVAALVVVAEPAAASAGSRSVDVASAPEPEFTAHGSYHTCAIVPPGAVKCWGLNEHGQLGQGTTAALGDGPGEMGANLAPVSLGTGRSATSVAVGDRHSCALLDNGQVKCWGYNNNGQLGLGDTSNRGDGPGEMGDSLPPVDLGTDRTATAVTAGYSFTCARLDNAQVKCWGYNGEGRLGLGHSTSVGRLPGEMGDNLPEVALGTGRTAVAVSAGANLVCALLDNGQVKCWGFNGSGELGQGNTTNRGSGPGQMGDSLLPVDLGTGRTATAVSAGFGQACALLDNGTVKCWGFNGDSRLGLGDTNNRGDAAAEMGDNLPTINLGTGRTATAVSVGDGHMCATLDNAGLKCWGLNPSGQLGLGDTTTRGTSGGQMGDNLPVVDLGTGRTATAITTGAGTCARLDDGTVKCWGLNDHGQLGQGDTANRGDAPGEMGDALPAVDLSAPPTITVVLDTGVDTGQDFAFTGCAGPDACGAFSLDHDNDPTLPSSRTSGTLAPGTYTVTAAALEHWSVTAIACNTGETIDLANRRATIQLDADDTNVTCTFSVRSQGIRIVLDADPRGPQDFNFQGCLVSAGCSSFSLDDDTDPTLSNTLTAPAIPVGTYTITQAAVPEWDLTVLTCDTGESVDLAARRVTIQLAATERVTCTFSVRSASITIVQDTSPDLGQDFSFTGCLGGGCAPFELDDDTDPALPRSVTGGGLAPATYTITQTSPGANWPLQSLTCDSQETVDLAARRVTISLAAGEHVTCTFTNKPTLITVVQDSVPDSAQDVAFTGCNAQSQCGPFTLDDDADPTSSNKLLAPGLDPGTYIVSQAVPAGWRLDALTCDTGGTADVPNARATITITAGQQITCTFRSGPAPANDARAAATAIADPPFLFPTTLTGSNVNASEEPGEPDHAGNPGGRSVWYRVRSLYDADVGIGTCSAGTTFDTLLAVYVPGLEGLVEVASNDDAGGNCPGGRSSLVFRATGGTSYLVAVDGKAAASGTFVLSWGTSTLPPCTPWPACF